MLPANRDAPSAPLGVRSVLSQIRSVLPQIKQDTFGTKDVQDAITASYVWLADEAGHVALGFVLTLMLCAIANMFLSADGPWRRETFLAIAILVYLLGLLKEERDRSDSEKRKGDVFPFDSGDIDWSVWTALFYYVVGIGLGASPFIWGWRGPIVVFVVAFIPIVTVGVWWLQRKLAFQQAGLPYLFRLANFKRTLQPRSVNLVRALANYRDRRVPLLDVLLGRSTEVDLTNPDARHILITGDLGAGKTSLCVGIGVEFALSLKRCRYLSAVKLVELVQGKDTRRDAAETAAAKSRRRDWNSWTDAISGSFRCATWSSSTMSTWSSGRTGHTGRSRPTSSIRKRS